MARPKFLQPMPLAVAGAAIGVALLLRLLSLVAPQYALIEHLEWDTYDWRVSQAFDRGQPVATNLAAIFIDDDSLKFINETKGYAYPWPRQLYGRVLRELRAQGAKAVAFDILFAETQKNLKETEVVLPDGKTEPSDAFFAREIRESGMAHLAVVSEKNGDTLALLLPADLFRTNGAHLGHIQGNADSDGVLRRIDPYLAASPTNRIWALGFELAAAHLGLDLQDAVSAPNGLQLRGANGAHRFIPLDASGRCLVNWTMRWNDPRLHKYSFEEVLGMDIARQNGETNQPNVFKDMLVVVGSIGSGNNISDRGTTPLGPNTPLVSKHWNVANQVLTDNFVRTCPLWLELVLVIALGLLALLLTWGTRAWLASILIAALALAYVLLALLLYTDYRFWLPVVAPVLGGLVFTHAVSTAYRVVFEQREHRRIKGIFNKLVSPNVVTELLQAEQISLGGARRHMTVFFADIRGFTELTDAAHARAEEFVRTNKLSGLAAEEMYSAQARETLATVNLYLGAVANVIKLHEGTLDKYIGDCVMAFWGAPTPNPRHAAQAVQAAMDAQRAIHNLNQQRSQENKNREEENKPRQAAGAVLRPLLPLLSLGSGINTGLVTVGLMGSDEHILNYTVFGREVNLASRLEGVSGRGRIIIGHATFEELQKHAPELAALCVQLPPVMVKGFRNTVQVYEVSWKTPEMAAGASAGR